MKLGMSRHELSELEKGWKAVEREAGQGERDIKKMQADAKNLRKIVDGTGWSTEKEQASEEALHRAKNGAMRCTQVRVCPLLHMEILSQHLVGCVETGCGTLAGLPT